MSAERVPEDRTSGLTGGPQPREAGPGTDLGSGRRLPRLQALAGLTVRGSDDRPVGRVRDIYQQDASGALAAITVMPRQLSARTVLIPAVAIEALPPLDEDRAGPRSDKCAPAPEAPGRETTAPHATARQAPGRRAPAMDVPSEDARAEDATGKDDVIRLRVDAATARAGRRPPAIAHVAPQDLREAAEALGLDDPDGGSR